MAFFIKILILLFWAVYSAKQILFWLYLWQIKEYRWDRMRAHFELPTSRNLILNKTALLFTALLALSFIPFQPAPYAVTIVTGSLLILAGGYAFYQFIRGRGKRPSFTPKIILLLFLVALSWGGVLFIFRGAGILNLLRLLLTLNIILPLILLIFVLALSPLTRLVRGRTIKKAMQKRAGLKNLLAIGITGSYGKTSTKEFLAHILRGGFHIATTQANHNTEMGVAQDILRKLSGKQEIFIAETGAYRRGEIADLCKIVQPQIGILTGINAQHSSLFGGIKNIQKAKYELIESLPAGGLAVFNGENRYCRTLFNGCKKPKRLYTADTIQKLSQSAQGTRCSIKLDSEKMIMDIPLLGRGALLNLTAAVTIARELGMSPEEIKKRIASLRMPLHTLQPRRGVKESLVIDDTYSANPEGVLEALEVLRSIGGEGKKICVMSPLIELGKTQRNVHKEIGVNIARSCDLCVVTGYDFFSDIQKEALEGGMTADAIVCIPDSFRAVRRVQEAVERGDIILLENRIPQEILWGLVISN